MNSSDFHTSILVDKTRVEAFDCINAVTKWWTENLEGSCEKLGDEFSVRFGDVHYSKQKLVELIPGRKLVWLVTESQLNFLEEKDEWTGTRISFEISTDGDKTKIDFRHIGLVPGIECFGACSNAWSQYIHQSLLKFINTGEGVPTRKENPTAIPVGE
jgi:hypothetical protein